jgi:superfamily II DNA or RNA helicase
MQITVSNEIQIIEPTEEVKAFCNKNLVILNPDFFKKQRLGFFVGKTPQTFSLYRKDAKKYYLPIGCLKDLLQEIKYEGEIKYDLADNPLVDYKCSVPLYDYQENAIESMLKENYGILQAPCGSGKTQVGISMAVKLQRKTLWLTHTTDLLTQSYERAKQYMDKELLGTITGGKVNISDGITFATVQTLSKQDLNLFKYSFDVIIVDECHRCAKSPNSLTMFSKVVNSLAARWKYSKHLRAFRTR